jgi:ATP-binding cassette subfamily B protein
MVKKSNSQKSINPISTMIKTTWQSLGKDKPKYSFAILLLIIGEAVLLMSPWLVGQIFNSIQSGQITTTDQLHNLFFLIAMLFAIQVIFWLFHYPGRLMQIFTGFYVHKNFSNEKIRKLIELPVAWHKDNHSGDTIDRMNKSRNALAAFAQHESNSLIGIIMGIVASLVLIFLVNPRIGTFAIISCGLIMAISMGTDKKVKKYYKEFNQCEHKLSEAIFDYFSNIITVITLRLKDTVKKKIDSRIQVSYPAHRKANFLMATKWMIAKLAISLMTVMALIWQANTDFKESGMIMIGTLFILYSYLDRVGNSFFQLAQFYGSMTKKAADIESVQPIDQAYQKIQSKINRNPPRTWNNIQIKNLNFSYNTEDENLHMKDVNLSFNRGEKIALIGESGSGKSTILSLIRGLYSTSAQVLVDNKKLTNGLETLKRQVTLIPQDPEIFNETISYNITMDMFNKKEDIQKAIQMAQFSSVVKKLPKGLDTSVQEKGVSLSGGEKQRLALARGLLAAKDSQIILLDEPTSSVDSGHERKIHENIFREFSDKTILSSIHRLHLLDKFDKIVIFDSGKIVAQGTYNEIKQNPIFQKIWRRYIGSKKK